MKNFAETVRDSADIVRVVSDYVTLKGAGNAFKALCPFHPEKTPSFSVHREKQLFHCFGCGEGGDVFAFVMTVEAVGFPEAVRIVAEKCGVPIPANAGADDKNAEEKKQLIDLYERAAVFFRERLASDEAAPARQILEKRQINDVFSKRFRIGFAPTAGLLSQLRPERPEMTGLFQKNDRGEVYDRFRRRLMFPIWSDRGRIIGFGGRALGDVQPKYLNSPESPLYSKSYVLYALHLAREAAQKASRMVVVEGYFDCLSLHQNGIENVVASCGTSLTGQQVALMSRYVPEVVMNYDPDVAGQNAIRRSIDLLLEKALRVRILRLPGSLDPDDFIRKEGREVYQRLLDGAPYFWQYLITDAGKRFDLEDPSLKAAAVKEIMDHVVKIQDRVEQLEVARAVAEGFKLPENVIFERLSVKPRRPEFKRVTRTDAPRQSRRLLDAERQLIQALGQDDKVSQALLPFLNDEFWKEAWSWPVLERLIQNPHSIDTALDGLQDEELAKEVRAAVMESVGPLTIQHAFSSVEQLYDAHLVRKEKEIRTQLEQYGDGPAPAELWKQYRELRDERHRVAETFESLKARG